MVSGQPLLPHRSECCHIDLVYVGPFLAVHLHIDEQGIHHFRHIWIFKGLMRHDMAPVAGGITDGKQNGPVELFRSIECIFAPRLPMHGILGMLAQIGARLFGEAVAVSEAFPV